MQAAGHRGEPSRRLVEALCSPGRDVHMKTALPGIVILLVAGFLVGQIAPQVLPSPRRTTARQDREERRPSPPGSPRPPRRRPSSRPSPPG